MAGLRLLSHGGTTIAFKGLGQDMLILVDCVWRFWRQEDISGKVGRITSLSAGRRRTGTS